MPGTAFKRILVGGAWASDATLGVLNRATPESEGLNRTDGFDLQYQIQGSGKYPQRLVFNQRHYEWDLAWRTKGLMGIPPWDSRVDYYAGAFCQVEGRIYVTDTAHGPETGNATNPETAGQTLWRRY